VDSLIAGAPAATQSSVMEVSNILSCEALLTLECRSQELDMIRLILRDFLHVLVERIRKPGIEKSLVDEVCESFRVESVPEVSKYQSMFENGNIIELSTFLDK
jgi:hypothetical protein